jgi:RimJ/RimL family protein N-acetyltransferase
VTAVRFPRDGLQCGELLLRAATVGDVPFIAPAFLDDSVGGEAGMPRLTASELRAFMDDQLAELQASGRLFPLVIIDGDAIVGGASLNNYEPFRDRVEIGYWLFPQGRGRGVATRAVRGLADHLFQVGVLRVEAVVRPENELSIRVLERAGFTREGLLRSVLRHGDGRADAILFSLLSGE